MATAENPPSSLITGAAEGRSKDLGRRQRNYLIMMAIRVACFLGMLVAPGNTKWLLLAGAVILPYVAVVVVNQTDQRGQRPRPAEPVTEREVAPTQRPAVAASPETIEGEVVEDERAFRALTRRPEDPTPPDGRRPRPDTRSRTRG